MTDEFPYTPPAPLEPPVSQRYRLWLTVALMLSLATITLSAVVVIITNARDRDRQEEFEMTLTGVWQVAQSGLATPAQTPTHAPFITPGVFPFAPGSEEPAYSAAENCSMQVLSGQIIDLAGAATDDYQVRVWGDYLRARSIFTGELANASPGMWSLVLTDSVNRRLWVQVAHGERTLSAPVEVVLNGADCERNRADILFIQTAPLE